MLQNMAGKQQNFNLSSLYNSFGFNKYVLSFSGICIYDICTKM